MSKKFKFSLDKLLEMRIEKEEESKRLFTESQAQKNLIEKNLQNLKESYNKYKGIKPGEDVIYQKLKRYYLRGLQTGIKTTEKQLEKKIEEVEEKRKDVKQKQIDRKTVETLRDKKYSEYMKEQDRIEQITIDELGLYGFIRNQHK